MLKYFYNSNFNPFLSSPIFFPILFLVLSLLFKLINGFDFLIKFSSYQQCAVHVAEFYSRKYEDKNETGISSIIARDNYELLMEQLNFNYIDHSLTDPRFWGVQHPYLETYLPNLAFSITRCVMFVIFEPSPQNILESVELSGYFVNNAASFVVHLSWSNYNNNYAFNNNTSERSQWPSRLLLTEIVLLFILENDEIGAFCYFCTNKVQLLPKEETVNTFQLYYKRLNHDLSGQYLAIDDVWYKMDTQCQPIRSSLRDYEANCFPIGRLFLSLLISKFNFTVKKLPNSEISANALWGSPPFLGTNYPMIMFPGPNSRILGGTRNYSQEFLINTTTDRLIYCNDKRISAAGGLVPLLSLLLSPFQTGVWVALIISTLGMIIIVQPVDLICMASIIFGQSYSQIGEGLGQSVRLYLLIFWSLVISTSISYLYNASLTADMLVPLPDYVIETFSELILKGFKIGYMDYAPLETAHSWFKNAFKGSIKGKEVVSFVPIRFDDSMFEHPIAHPGKIAIFTIENELERSMLKTHRRIWETKAEVKCHLVKESLSGVVLHASHFLFHMSATFFETLQRIIETGIPNEVKKLRVWEETSLVQTPWNELGFKAGGFSDNSKLPIIFISFVLCASISFVVFMLELLHALIQKCFRKY